MLTAGKDLFDLAVDEELGRQERARKTVLAQSLVFVAAQEQDVGDGIMPGGPEPRMIDVVLIHPPCGEVQLIHPAIRAMQMRDRFSKHAVFANRPKGPVLEESMGIGPVEFEDDLQAVQRCSGTAIRQRY